MGAGVGAHDFARVEFRFAILRRAATHDIERAQQTAPVDVRYVTTRLDDFYRNRDWTVGMAVTTGVTAALSGFALLLGTSKPSHTQRQTPFSVEVSSQSIDLHWRF